ncbi:MAG: hypothetical protein JXA46_09590, partial [Dehalococcoidales bacterium]|nr:hypothetical protein [Dehalococcoidales bacterium]
AVPGSDIKRSPPPAAQAGIDNGIKRSPPPAAQAGIDNGIKRSPPPAAQAGIDNGIKRSPPLQPASEKAMAAATSPAETAAAEAAPLEDSASLKVSEPVPPPAPPVEERTASAPPESVPAVSPPLSSEIERLRINWRQILEDLPPSIKRSGSAVALLRTVGPPSSMSNDTVTLSAKSKIFKDNIEKAENMRVIEGIISDYLGHSCKVECILDEKKHHLVNHAIKMGAQITSEE